MSKGAVEYAERKRECVDVVVVVVATAAVSLPRDVCHSTPNRQLPLLISPAASVPPNSLFRLSPSLNLGPHIDGAEFSELRSVQGTSFEVSQHCPSSVPSEPVELCFSSADPSVSHPTTRPAGHISSLTLSHALTHARTLMHSHAFTRPFPISRERLIIG